MSKRIILVLMGFTGIKSKMWDSLSKVKFTTNLDQFTESLSYYCIDR